MLPPPRTPAMRIAKRPVLVIVDEEEAAPLTPKHALVVAIHLRVATLARQRPVRSALAAALAAVVVVGSLALLLGSSDGGAQPITGAVSGATAVPVSTALFVPARVTEPSAPAVPVVDVNSLPSAPRKR